MEFSLPEICRILDLKRDRIQQWLDRGYISPSIKKASGQGTRNIFSREDLYVIAVFKDLTQGGWLRDAAAALIKAIDLKKDIGLLITLRLWNKMLKEKIQFGEFQVGNLMAEATKMDKNDPALRKAAACYEEHMVKGLDEISNSVELLLLFLRFRVGKLSIDIQCIPIVEGDTSDKKGGKPVAQTMNDVLPEICKATDVYILNFGMLMDSVDQILYALFPKKFLGHLHQELLRVLGEKGLAGIENIARQKALKTLALDGET